MHRLAADIKEKLGGTVRAVYQHWISMSPGPELLPGRQHLDPTEIPALLPNIWLVDIERNPRVYRYRLVGTAIVEAMRGDFTGKTIEEMVERDAVEGTLTTLDRIVETGEPSWRKGLPVVERDRRYSLLERFYLPLATDGRTIDMLLGCAQYHQAGQAEANGAPYRIPPDLG